MNIKPYKENTPLQAILEDGWSRDFQPEQTQIEAHTMGYEISIEDILSSWQKKDIAMWNHFL